MIVQAVIKPNSKHREEVVELEDGSLVVYTKEPAIEDRANKDAIKLLARKYNTNRSRVNLIRGQTSKLKVFKVSLD